MEFATSETKKEMLHAVKQQSTIVGSYWNGLVKNFLPLSESRLHEAGKEGQGLENSGKYKWPVEHGPYACKFTFKTVDTLLWQGLNSR